MRKKIKGGYGQIKVTDFFKSIKSSWIKGMPQANWMTTGVTSWTENLNFNQDLGKKSTPGEETNSHQ